MPNTLNSTRARGIYAKAAPRHGSFQPPLPLQVVRGPTFFFIRAICRAGTSGSGLHINQARARPVANPAPGSGRQSLAPGAVNQNRYFGDMEKRFSVRSEKSAFLEFLPAPLPVINLAEFLHRYARAREAMKGLSSIALTYCTWQGWVKSSDLHGRTPRPKDLFTPSKFYFQFQIVTPKAGQPKRTT